MPKGVMIEHRGLVDYFSGLVKRIQIDQCKSFALVSTIATDLGNTVIYSSLLSGGALHIFTKDSVSNIEYLHDYFQQNRIDCLKIVPSHWKALSNDGAHLWPEKLLVFGGEVLHANIVDDISVSGTKCKIVNHYGPTETTIGKLLHEVNKNTTYQNTIPIGRPFSNARVYVLNSEMQLCPVGVAGQLFIAGDGVARGYWHNTALTKEKFTTELFNVENADGQKMYGTGDLVKWLPAGEILFIGRVDDQVKIRGYRIELGEIESALQQHKKIEQAIVIAREDKKGDKRLIGYLVSNEEFDREEIQSFLREKFPDYMIPSALIRLENLPLTANGKVDRKALPDPEDDRGFAGYTAPRNEIEFKLTEIWKDVLELEQVSVYDDFFELGGHSLLAIRLISAIRKAFGVEMPIGDIFDFPKVALLAEKIQNQSKVSTVPPIQVTEPRPQRIPLSFSQERLWFIDRLEGSIHYHIPTVLKISGSLNENLVKTALQTILKRHEVLRSVINEKDGQGYQTVIPFESWDLLKKDGKEFLNDPIALRAHIDSVINQRFNLATDYTLRAQLIKLSVDEHILVVVLHHIASDGWSATVIMKELVEVFKAVDLEKDVNLWAVPIQYADFAIWQRNYLQGDVLDEKLSYWKKNLQLLAPLELPTDYPRPAILNITGNVRQFNIDAKLTSELRSLSSKQGTTLFMTVLAIFKILLFKYSGQSDICVGTPVAGRQHQETESLVGFFINTLALRSDLGNNPEFINLLQGVKDTTLKAYEYQDVPFEKVVDAVVSGRDLSRHPLFQVSFVFQNTPEAPALNIGGLMLTPMKSIRHTSKFDLTLSISETVNGLDANLTYADALFKESTIEQLIKHFRQLIKSVLKNPSQNLASLKMISQEEEEQLLVQFNGTNVEYPKNKTIIDLFDEQVRKNPGRIAIQFESEKITYEKLDQYSSRFASYLQKKGVGPEKLVPLCLERSWEMIVVIMGIMKAGGAYVPIDPGYPVERIQYIVEDTSGTILITNKIIKEKVVPLLGITIVDIEEEWDEIVADTQQAFEYPARPSNLAYVIYTSGSTGRPKGVMIEHAALLDHCFGLIKSADLRKCSSFALFAPLVFDAGHAIIHSSFILGASLHVISKGMLVNGKQLSDYVNHHQIDCIKIVPSLWLTYVESKYLILAKKVMIFGGEGFALRIINGLKDANYSGVVYNHYGPTEATIGKCIYKVDLEKTYTNIPIGKPFSNTQVYILDDAFSIVPVGVPGELYIAGDGLARGYLNLPQMTIEKFILRSFGSGTESLMYKTGDKARWLPGGDIEYLGRVDEQVKIRGLRVEIGEIESEILRSGLVRNAIVVAHDDGIGNKYLTGYVVVDKLFEKDSMLVYLRKRLPENMIPGSWVKMEKFPLTSNGKIDKKSLPLPDKKEMRSSSLTLPRNELEKTLAAIWATLLKREDIGVFDNFFEIGGHSLLGMQLISMIRQNVTIEVPLKELFIHPTIAGLAEFIGEQDNSSVRHSILKSDKPIKIPLSFSQERLWFIDQLEGSLQYHIPVVLRLKGDLNKEALNYALNSILKRHEVLRTVLLEEDGTPFQSIKDDYEEELIDIKWTAHKNDYGGVQSLIIELITKPFDLSKDNMLRASLVEIREQDYVLVVILHHIASDGWSRSLLVKEVVEYYDSYIKNRAPDLSELPIQFSDYAIWQRSYLQGEVFDQKLKYWKHQLENISPLQLPTDFPRPPIQSTRGAVFAFSVDKELTDGLHELTNRNGSTLFMTLLSVFNVLLYRYSNTSDICIGTPTAGRQQKELEDLIGFFLNTLAIRTRLTDDISFNELLGQVRSTSLDAFENQEIPFEKVVEAVVRDRDMSRTPVFQVMFILQNTPEVSELKLGDVIVSTHNHERTASKFDMALFMIESDKGMHGKVEYCTDLFLPATIEKIINHFLELLRSVVNQPSQKIGLLPMLSSIEEQRLLVEFNDTSTPYPLYKSLVTLFEEQVEHNPGNTALIFENEIYTYSQLNQQANQLAHFLRKKGVNEKSVVPLCIERSANMVVGLLGILKTGACYVPVDPEYPIDRVVYMIRDSGAEIVVSNKAAQQKLTGIAGLTILSFDEKGVAIAKESKENLNVQIGADDLAYVIYTSGSTGKPKGVMVENRGLVNLLFSVRDSVDFNSFSSFLSVTTFSFDISYLELFLPLVTGGKLFLVPREIAIDGFRLASMLSNYRPTHMQATPFTWLLLLDTNWKNEENITMLIGGEAVKEDVKEKLTALGDLYNMYGPTETTIWSVMKKLAAQQKVLIGKPIANTSIYILSKDLRLVPTGVSGEICIAGAGLARGYFNLPELTSEKFISNPFSNLPGEKLYKTGDLGRWTADGNIECLGRLDEQVKIRGYRIELGEIETSILQSDLVTQAAVLVKEDGENNSRLIAYFIPAMKSLKEKERSLYESQVIVWREIYEAEYAVRNENMETEFDINIWKSSFNGELINSHHMQEWVDDIVTEVLSESPENLLEIGTGSGFIFYRLAAHVKKYIGTDFSQSSIDHIVQRVDNAEKNYGEVSFKVCAAHEIVLGEDEKVDTILLNSVVQYFPGEDYMTRVIEKSISLLKDGGRVIIGDVRDNRLLPLFKGRLQLQKLHQSVNFQEYNWWVNQELMKEEELCFSPEYFSMLKTIYPRITNVEIKWKQASYINELSAYRYTVILHIDDRKPVFSPDWKTLKNAGVAQLIIRQLENEEPIIALKKIANPRLKEEKLLSKVLKEKTVNNVGEILQSLQAVDEEINEIAEILDLAKLKGYESSLFLDEDPLKINLLLQLRPSDEFIEMPSGEKITGESSLFTNTPLFNDICFLIQKELRTGLQNSLPDYMVPVDFFGVQEFPLTNNGKVDRKFLSQRQNTGMRSNINYEPPATEIQIKLANIWMELLGIERVGIFDNFFELGGHSLLAMRIISAIRSQFDVELAIKDLFQFTTIDELSKYLEIQLNVYSKEGDDGEFDLLYI
ncbi:MAG: amino acid adenylation domain-containing protein [Ginsengibacter sp.]